jgi:hypothetical protein
MERCRSLVSSTAILELKLGRHSKLLVYERSLPSSSEDVATKRLKSTWKECRRRRSMAKKDHSSSPPTARGWKDRPHFVPQSLGPCLSISRHAFTERVRLGERYPGFALVGERRCLGAGWLRLLNMTLPSTMTISERQTLRGTRTRYKGELRERILYPSIGTRSCQARERRSGEML